MAGGPGQARAIQADVRETAIVHIRLSMPCSTSGGVLDVLVNSAGIVRDGVDGGR